MQINSTMEEADFISIFQQYNLYDALSCFSRMSYYIKLNSDERNINGFAYIDGKYLISQSILAYLTNMILISASNEHKAKCLSQEANKIFKLASDYSNKLAEFSDDYESLDKESQCKTLFIRLYYEQTRLQFKQKWIYARAILIYTKYLDESYRELFITETGLSIEEYFIFSYLLLSLDPHSNLIHKNISFDEQLTQLKPKTFTPTKLEKYLDLLSCDYKAFKELDKKMNEKHHGLSRLRLNPLNTYPIIKTGKKYLKKYPIYIIPNYSLFNLKHSEGLFWFFIDHAAKKDTEAGIKVKANTGEDAKFRDAFGKAFKLYVGELLKKIYGEKNVSDADSSNAIKVGKKGEEKPLGDWYVNLESKIYIIEVKARRYNRASQSLNIKALDEELKKFTKNLEQVYNTVKKLKADINNEQSTLGAFKNKSIIPVLINYEIPYLGMENSIPKDGLAEVEIYYSDIYSLEIYFDILKNGEACLEEVFQSLTRKNSIERMQGNSFLDQVHQDFFDL